MLPAAIKKSGAIGNTPGVPNQCHAEIAWLSTFAQHDGAESDNFTRQRIVFMDGPRYFLGEHRLAQRLWHWRNGPDWFGLRTHDGGRFKMNLIIFQSAHEMKDLKGELPAFGEIF